MIKALLANKYWFIYCMAAFKPFIDRLLWIYLAGMGITMSGTRSWPASTMCWVSSGIWSTTERSPSKTSKTTSAPARSHLSRWLKCFYAVIPSTCLMKHLPWSGVFVWSLATGVRTPTRTRCRGRCSTKAVMSFTGLEDFGMKESSVTLFQLQNVFGSRVSFIFWVWYQWNPLL